MAALKVSLKGRFAKTILCYCDESSQTKHRYFVIGAVFLECQQSVVGTSEGIETSLQAIKDAYDIGTAKWEKVPTQSGKRFAGYRTLLEQILEAGISFKCLVVDTYRYPLDNKTRWGGDPLVGYLKFYCVFLADGLMARFPQYYWDIRIDQFQFRDGCDADTLGETTERRFVKKQKPESCISYCKVEPLDHRLHNLLQMADLLVGAVAFAWNGGMKRSSARASTRIALCKLIEQKRNVRLDSPTSWSKRDFNIWHFRP